MIINSQFDPNQIPECNDKLKEILEAYGIDVFCEAVTELFNYHPLTKPANYSYKSWVVLMLPNDFEPDSIVEIENIILTASDA
ncbi:MAG: hypothetical protein HC836_38520 [Richelia sp. RM2_1_2]|nr:hypothetical protein [Richelia sp. SM1_7_0]NJN13787.1 hypothetical protein [Richelia sp. RM1_1_1]NJO29010.1 hypothetical protein [Richelia sp. SL_2_1]NJO63871.1 hypothetical protein [Richelia sp. RM2_1_2]